MRFQQYGSHNGDGPAPGNIRCKIATISSLTLDQIRKRHRLLKDPTGIKQPFSLKSQIRWVVLLMLPQHGRRDSVQSPTPSPTKAGSLPRLSQDTPKKNQARIKSPQTRSRSRSSRSKSSSRSTSRPQTVAGYVPPDAEAGEEWLQRAKGMGRSLDRFKSFIKEKPTKLACFEVGVEPEDLLPKKLKDFRREENRAQVLPPEVQQRRFDHFENRRIWKLAIVLKEREKVLEEEAQRKQKEVSQESQLLNMFKEHMRKEQKRNLHISSSQQKVKEVLLRENEALQKRRKAFEDRFKAASERQRRIEQAKEEEREAMKRRAAERQAEIEKVQQQREERMQQQIDNMLETFKERDRKVEEFLKQKEEGLQKSVLHREKSRHQLIGVREKVKRIDEERREQLRKHLEEKVSYNLSCNMHPSKLSTGAQS